MTQRFLRTSRVLPLRDAPSAGDLTVYSRLTAGAPGTANTLTPAWERLDACNRKLAAVAKHAVAGPENDTAFFDTNSSFLPGSRVTLDHVTNVAAAVEGVAAAANEISRLLDTPNPERRP